MRLFAPHAYLALISLFCGTAVNFVHASSPTVPSISSLSVTLRGQKYEVSDVTTVGDLQEKVNVLSGVSPKQQGRVIFGGKRLEGSDTVLADAGVPTEGAQVNMVPSTTTSKASAKSSKKKKSASTTAIKAEAIATSSSSSSGSSPNNVMADLLKQSGIDSSALDEMMKSMGGGADGAPPNMEEGFKAMTEAMNSPLFKEMMGDPERLEQSRQMILNNPMLKSMMSSMPGMEDILNDEVAWRQAMQAAAELYKNIDTDTLMKSMMGGATDAAAAASTNGLFDGTLPQDATTAAALNELDEDD